MRSTGQVLARFVCHSVLALACLPCVAVAAPAQSTSSIDATEARASSGTESLLRGLELYRQSDLDGAEKSLNESIRLDPTLVEAYLVLGEIRLRQGKLDEAQDIVRKAMAVRPNTPSILVAMGN